MEMFQKLSSTFWNSDFWLPENITWADVAPNSHPEIKHADSNHLFLYPLPIAFVLFILRRFLEKRVFVPFGTYLGINSTDKQRKALPITMLERSFQLSTRPSLKTVQGFAKQLDWSEVKVERWFRTRRLQDQPTTMTKFSETMWRAVYYSCSFMFGCILLWETEWLWEIQLCWKNYPHQSVDDGVWWYYMLNLGFYWSLCFTQFVDVKRKDFWQMFSHHLATLALLSISWVCNMTRMGSLILVVHDCPDVVLEYAKCAKFAGYQKVCDYIFSFFVPLWIVTRCGVFPFWIIKKYILFSTILDAADINQWFPAVYILNGLVLGLLMLNIFWTYFILKLVRNTLVSGFVLKDVRSESEDD